MYAYVLVSHFLVLVYLHEARAPYRGWALRRRRRLACVRQPRAERGVDAAFGYGAPAWGTTCLGARAVRGGVDVALRLAAVHYNKCSYVRTLVKDTVARFVDLS